MVPINRLPSVPGLSSLAEATTQPCPFSDLAQGGGGGNKGVSVMMS